MYTDNKLQCTSINEIMLFTETGYVASVLGINNSPVVISARLIICQPVHIDQMNY